MANRGDIVQLRSPLGFGRDGEGELFAIIQDDGLSSMRDTTVAWPLDVATALYSGSPIAIPVTAEEAGTPEDRVVLATHPRTLLITKLKPGRVGRLRPETIAALEAALQVVLGLP